MAKDLSIIIPSYNTKGTTLNCISSIYKETKNIDFEIIVVDNASTDGTVGAIEKQFPQAKIIKNKKNIGYGRANNQALRRILRQAQDEKQNNYILFLNSDTIILDKAIEKCVEYIKKNKKIDVLGCQLLNKDRSIQPSGGYFPTLFRVFCWMFFVHNLPILKNFLKAYQEKRNGFYKKEREVDWLTGAFLLVKRQVFDKINGFDKDFFMYAEEVELLYRVKKAGFRVFFWPGAKTIHLKGKSSKKGFEKAVLGEYKGLVKFYKKHKKDWQKNLLYVQLRLGALLRVLIFGILKKERKRKVYEKAFRLV